MEENGKSPGRLSEYIQIISFLKSNRIFRWTIYPLVWFFLVVDWLCSWLVFLAMNLGIFKLGGVIILVFSLLTLWEDIRGREQDQILKAWNIVYTSADKGGDGMKNALEFLNQKGMHLNNLDLSGSILDGINLEGAHLNGVKFNKSSLINANLKGAKLQNTDFELADLSGAKLRQADLKAARFPFANLINTDLTESDLRYSSIHAGKMKKNNKWTVSIKGANIYRVGEFDGMILSMGFREWAISEGAVEIESNENWTIYEDPHRGVPS